MLLASRVLHQHWAVQLRLAHQPQVLGKVSSSGPENHSSYSLVRDASCLSFDSFCLDAKCQMNQDFKILKGVKDLAN